MNIKIQAESESDIDIVNQLVEHAFKKTSFINHREHIVVKELRLAPTFIPKLSLTLRLDQKIIGYSLFTPIVIKDTDKSNVSLALTILTISPQYRKLGFASQLISEGIAIAQQLGFKSLVAMGDLNYFKKFGFRPSADFKIYNSIPNLTTQSLLLELENNGLNAVHGKMLFPKEISSTVLSEI